MTRDLVSLLTDKPPASFRVEVRPELSDEQQQLVDQLLEARDAAELAQRAAADTTREAVRQLAEQLLSARDIGHLVGLSFQRVSQIEREFSQTARPSSHVEMTSARGHRVSAPPTRRLVAAKATPAPRGKRRAG